MAKRFLSEKLALGDLQASIAEGDAQIARGQSTDGEVFFDELETELEREPRARS